MNANKYFDVNSLLTQAENTKFTLHEHKPTRLERYYDEKAASVLDEVNKNYSGEKRREVYASRMAALNVERCEHIDKIGEYIKEAMQLLETLTSIQETIETNEEISLLLNEQTALLYQSTRAPWSQV